MKRCGMMLLSTLLLLALCVCALGEGALTDATPAWKKRPWARLEKGTLELNTLVPARDTPITGDFLFAAEAGDTAGREKYLGAGALLTRENLPATETWTPPDLSGITADAPAELLLVAIAQNEMGYTEGPDNENPYSYFLTGRYDAWCSEFVAYCNAQVQLRYGRQVVGKVFPVMTLSDYGMLFFKQAGRFVTATAKNAQYFLAAPETALGKRDYIPQVGDHMWFMWEQSSHTTGHTAIVEGVSVDKKGVVWVHTLEGNNNKSTQRRNQRLLADHIYGYGTPVRTVQRALRRGDEGDDVVALKLALSELGLYQTEENNARVFTAALRDALKGFQRAQGLEETGILDNLTYLALKNAYYARPGA